MPTACPPPVGALQRFSPARSPTVEVVEARWWSVPGVVAPAAFVGAWAIAGARTPGYSPVERAISRLAEIGAPQRPLMTAGMVAFGVTVPVFALGARKVLGRAPAASLAWAGVATLAVAALPLRPDEDGTAHAVAAIAAYAGTAGAPLLSRGLGARLLGAASAALLAASFAGPATGLFQRAGLTLVDAWIVHRAVTR